MALLPFFVLIDKKNCSVLLNRQKEVHIYMNDMHILLNVLYVNAHGSQLVLGISIIGV